MLYLIGIGLGDEKDLTLRGLETIKRCSHVYFESYTSIYNGNFKKLEKMIGKKLIFADRKMIEVDCNVILEKAKKNDVALLIMGDVFSATTHADIILRAAEMKINVSVIHNASILTAIGDCGLSLYKFGKIASIPFVTDDWKVESPYDLLKENKDSHTLFLLDLKTKENKTMSFNEGIEFLVRIEEKRKEGLLTEKTNVVGLAGLGSSKAKIFYGPISKVLKKKVNIYPQCFIIPGKLHFIEEEMLERFKI